MLKLNAVFNAVGGSLVFFVFISLHISLSHICMVKVLAAIYNRKPNNEHPLVFHMGDPWLRRHSSSRALSSSSFGPFRSDWSGCSEQSPYFTHSVRHRVRKILPFNSRIPYNCSCNWSFTWVSDRF